MQARNTIRRGDNLINDTLALILAGGVGSRLKSLTDWHSKPAIPFGGEFRTIDFSLSNCIHSGIRRIGILTQYKSHSLNRHIQRGWNFINSAPRSCIELLPAQQRLCKNWYQGTANAVYQNIDIIGDHSARTVLILAGDHVYNMDYTDLLQHHQESGADLTVGCIEIDTGSAVDFGVMEVNKHNRILGFEEKPAFPQEIVNKPGRSLASMGIYVFNAEFLKKVLIEDAHNSESSHDFGKDIIPRIIDQYHINAYPFQNEQGGPAYWRDVGTIDSYWKANMELLGAHPKLDIYNEQWPIWTAQEQHPPAKFQFDAEYNCQGSAISSIVARGCIIKGALVRDSVLFACSSIDSGSNISESLLLSGANIGKNCWLNRVVVDQGCHIPDGTVIGVDYDDDVARYHVSPGGIILVSSESLCKQAPAQLQAVSG